MLSLLVNLQYNHRVNNAELSCRVYGPIQHINCWQGFLLDLLNNFLQGSWFVFIWSLLFDLPLCLFIWSLSFDLSLSFLTLLFGLPLSLSTLPFDLLVFSCGPYSDLPLSFPLVLALWFAMSLWTIPFGLPDLGGTLLTYKQSTVQLLWIDTLTQQTVGTEKEGCLDIIIKWMWIVWVMPNSTQRGRQTGQPLNLYTEVGIQSSFNGSWPRASTTLHAIHYFMQQARHHYCVCSKQMCIVWTMSWSVPHTSVICSTPLTSSSSSILKLSLIVKCIVSCL